MDKVVKIPLSQGAFALIDESDLSVIQQFKWCAHKHWHTKKLYAYSHNMGLMYIKSRSYVVVKMHRVIMGVTDPNVFVDHKDGNPLNNTRKNLRVCTPQQNNRNLSKTRSDSKFKYRGLYQPHNSKKVCARITIDGNKIHLGSFESHEAAAMAYNEAAKKYFGEFASLNKITYTEYQT